jgi:RNA polymerase sigma-70 factor (ECF subfamily)
VEKEFVELINKHNAILHKVCNIYFYGDSNKEDYHQEILIRLWKSFPGFKKQSRFSTWMYRVAINSAIDIIRKLKIQPVLTELSKNEFDMSISDKGGESDEKEILYRAINKLSDGEKAIIMLYLDDFSYNEISEIVGISETNTGVKINRIKKQLIKIIDEYEER